jgi:hypothetical protein
LPSKKWALDPLRCQCTLSPVEASLFVTPKISSIPSSSIPAS